MILLVHGLVCNEESMCSPSHNTGKHYNQEDPRLKQLADGLYDTVLQGKAPATTLVALEGGNYGQQTTNYRCFQPTSVMLAVLYLEHLGEIKGSKGSYRRGCECPDMGTLLIRSATPPPSFVQVALDELRRTHAKPVKKSHSRLRC